ncbi:hypothetical protein [Massilia consociata]|uniref:Uncharacterized protein n=1 Tax=Massilia consociata TaxID=760117 RepID=A0ABV6FIM2_9BURK
MTNRTNEGGLPRLAGNHPSQTRTQIRAQSRPRVRLRGGSQ